MKNPHCRFPTMGIFVWDRAVGLIGGIIYCPWRQKFIDAKKRNTIATAAPPDRISTIGRSMAADGFLLSSVFVMISLSTELLETSWF